MSEGVEKLSVGVILERRAVENKWIDHTWHPIGAIPNPPESEPWRRLAEGDGWIQYMARVLEIELHRGETEGYKLNLEGRPMVYVVLRPDDDPDHPHEVEAFHVTVCPFEAERYVESGGEIVEGISMAPEIAAWVQDFVDKHHVEVSFQKRKRKPYDPRKGDLGRPRPGLRSGGGGNDG